MTPRVLKYRGVVLEVQLTLWKSKKKNNTAHGHLNQNELIDEKNWVQQNSWDCPFKYTEKTKGQCKIDSVCTDPVFNKIEKFPQAVHIQHVKVKHIWDGRENSAVNILTINVSKYWHTQNGGVWGDMTCITIYIAAPTPLQMTALTLSCTTDVVTFLDSDTSWIA